MHFGLFIIEFVASKEIDKVCSQTINVCLVHKVVTTLGVDMLYICEDVVYIWSVHTVESNKPLRIHIFLITIMKH